MNSFEEIRQGRIKKLNELKKAGQEPFPAEVPEILSLEEIQSSFNKLKAKKKPFWAAGRLMACREHGGLLFADLYDGTVKMQICFRKDDLSEELFKIFKDQVDIGDFILIEGKPFLTKKKERTLAVSAWRILSKSLRPLPEKWHGLQDVEERYRRRYLDLLMNDEIKKRFLARSKIISETRNFLEENGYLEVETPILQPLAGGAAAVPFKTHHQALDIDLYLRIAPELYLKKLLVGGLNKIYELGRNFRNEGIDATHNPEFTMLEFYEAYSDAKKQRVFVEKMIKHLVKKVLKKNYLEYGGIKIDFSQKFSVISYFDLLKKYALILDPKSASNYDLALIAKRLGVEAADSDAKDKIMDNIYKKICRPRLIQPIFIIDYPAEFSPFAKINPEKPEFIDRFQLVIGGLELVNAFSELNDPLEQRERFLEQDRKRKEGEADVSPSDEEYLEAMEYGMPPAGGVGIGFDRLMMLLTGAQNIREVILFPTLRPKPSH
ncbi:MAG: lysine--tRNA ligase [Candidatus Niyogibacteria bacterium]|nr:lysine--tRNA ligase [Candidatus Niyogibacteria bacterium]